MWLLGTDMYCLDTDVLIDYLRGNKQVFEKLSFFFTHGIGLFTTFINVCELYKGVYLSKKKDKEEGEVRSLIDTVKPIGMDHYSCTFFGKEWSRLQKEGKTTQILDLMIASVAVANNLTLITKNRRHYENIAGLKIEEI